MQFLHNFLFLLYQTSLWLQNINKLLLRVKVTNDSLTSVYALFICGRRSALYNTIYGIMSRLTASSIGFWRNGQCCVAMQVTYEQPVSGISRRLPTQYPTTVTSRRPLCGAQHLSHDAITMQRECTYRAILRMA